MKANKTARVVSSSAIAFVLLIVLVGIPWSLTDEGKLAILSATYQHEWYFLYLVVVLEIAAFLSAVTFTILTLRLLWHAGTWFQRSQRGTPFRCALEARSNRVIQEIADTLRVVEEVADTGPPQP
jgi:NADH:ubiquinone oxidoreductase subunit 2 (subunit N)